MISVAISLEIFGHVIQCITICRHILDMKYVKYLSTYDATYNSTYKTCISEMASIRRQYTNMYSCKMT